MKCSIYANANAFVECSKINRFDSVDVHMIILVVGIVAIAAADIILMVGMIIIMM